ncbi:MAG: hypothetical protein ACI81F_002623 [Thalassolituus oleivorans]|jgi:hypothetical protein
MRLSLLNPVLGRASWLLLALVLASDALAKTTSPSSLAPSAAIATEFEKSQQIAEAEPVAGSPLPYEIIELNRGETFNLFSMGKKVWDDTGLPVLVFVLPSRHALHKQFAKQKIGSFPHVLSAIWDRQVYSGSGRRPNEVKNAQEMRRAISSIAGAVGYLPGPAGSSQIIVVRNK